MAAAALPNYLAAKEAARQRFGLQPNDYAVYENSPEWTLAVVDAWERKTERGSNSSHGMELSGALRYAKQNPIASLAMNFYNQAGKVYSLFPMAANALDRGDYAGAGKLAAAG